MSAINVRMIGPAAFLFIGEDGVIGVPVADIMVIRHRRKALDSWVTFFMRDGRSYSVSAPHEPAEEIISWLENLPAGALPFDNP